MILCIFGTTAEAIKLAPVLSRLQKEGAPFMLICTGQHVTEIPSTLHELGLRQPELWLAHGYRGRDLQRNVDTPRWLVTVIAAFVANYRRLRKLVPKLVLVQGDTFTTVIGAVIGRLLWSKVAHVEAGVRSWDLRHPFPEELNRRLISRLAQIHFAPGNVAVANLDGSSGTVVNTTMNTVQDSLKMLPDRIDDLPTVPERFGIVSLHRFELINDRSAFLRTLRVLRDHSDQTALLFIDHPITAEKIRQYRLNELFDRERFVRVPKLPYFQFVTLLRRSEFSVTDSGGLQQESYYVNHPCLVHRAKVETFEGIGSNIVVSGMDLAVLKDFLSEPARFRRKDEGNTISPSEVVVSYLAEKGYLN